MAHLTVEEKYADPAVVGFWQSLGRQGLQKAELDMVTRYLPATGHLLDIGCGTGRAVLGLGIRGYTVTGIDLSLPMLKAGRSLNPEIQLGGANLLALPFSNNTFTAAFMFFGALQHISGQHNRRHALAEISRVVRPDGYFILGLDNLAPTLFCYAYWLKEKFITSSPTSPSAQITTADATLWNRDTHPLIWHLRGLARTLRWRTWPGLVDIPRRFDILPNSLEPGDVQVSQFSRPATPGLIYYHIYRALELIEDAAYAGWSLLGFHAGSELSEGRLYPPFIRQQDKQLFFAFQKMV